MNEIDIIQKYSLTVRYLPHKVVNNWTYREGDENKKYADSNGFPSKTKRTVVIKNYDLKYFENTPPHKWDKHLTPQQRLERYLKTNPSGQRKFLREEKDVNNGGWWYVKETQNTDSIVIFSRKYDEFFAPTLMEALNLYLESIKKTASNKL